MQYCKMDQIETSRFHCWSVDGAVLTTVLCSAFSALAHLFPSQVTLMRKQRFSGRFSCSFLCVCWWSLYIHQHQLWYFLGGHHRSPALGQSTGQTPTACRYQTHITLHACFHSCDDPLLTQNLPKLQSNSWAKSCVNNCAVLCEI